MFNVPVACSGAAGRREREGRRSGGLCDPDREREEYQRAKRSQVSVTAVDPVLRVAESITIFSHKIQNKSFTVFVITDALMFTLIISIDNCRFKVNLHQCLIQISGYNVLFTTVEELRQEVFDSENEEHEKMLLKVSDLRFLLTLLTCDLAEL